MSANSLAPAPPDRGDGKPHGAWRFHLCAGAIVFLLAFFLFYNSIGNGFVWDDFDLIVNGAEIRDPFNFQNIFFTKPHDIYRPFRTFVYALIYRVGKLDPMGYHLFNIALNALYSALFYWIAFKIFRNGWKAFAAAALFSAHPIHSEAVAYIAGLADILGAVLMAGAMLCLWDVEGKRASWLLLPGMALFALALLSKEVTVVLPPLLLALDVIVEKRAFTWRLIFRRLPLFLLCAIFLAYRFLVIGVAAQARVIYGWDASTVAPSVVKLIPYYLGELFSPLGLCPDFLRFKLAHSFADPAVFGAVLGCVCGAALFFVFWKRARPLAFAVVWFFLTLLPVMQIVPLGTFCADRYMYLPSAGFCIALVYVFCGVARRLASNAAVRSAGLAAALLSGVVFWGRLVPPQNRIWKDEITLYRTMTRCAPASYYAYNKLGKALMREKKPTEALSQFEKAKELYSSNTVILKNLGSAYASLGRFADAEKEFARAHAIDPADGELLYLIGMAREKEGRIESAMDAYRENLKEHPDHWRSKRRLEELRKR